MQNLKDRGPTTGHDLSPFAEMHPVRARHGTGSEPPQPRRVLTVAGICHSCHEDETGAAI
ncbi:protein of unknown function [Micropruina glycogenica]|uniref:Uncharacterized protein n=1 Tax=Micropruina glycogenica TaxID=75385 RepID=A0A2N9JLJ8_9ACTN|nr:protein of unknown function [Micropruina glycogenica]